MKIRFRVFVLILFYFSMAVTCNVFAQEKVSEDKTEVPVSAADEVKDLEEKEKKTEEVIKQKEEAVEAIKQEAEKVSEEKAKVEEEAILKQKEAELAQEKAEALKKKAEVENNREIELVADRLEKEAEKLKEEADVSLKELDIIKVQEELVQKRISDNQAKIDELKNLVQVIKKEKTLKRSLLEKLIVAVGSIIIGIILFSILKLGTNRLSRIFVKGDEIREDELSLRMKTTAKLLNWMGGFLIVGIVLFMVLETFGFSLGPLLAGAGIMGLAFGFGGQYLIRDLINGLFILIEGQYRVDDVVKINDMGGLVEDINLRLTTLRDLAGRVIIIPNGEIKAVINYTRGYSQALLDIGVAYKENVDQVIGIIKEVGKNMRSDPYFGRLILDDLEMFGVDDFADSAVMIKFRIKTRPIKQWEVSREFKRRLKNRFDEIGIEIPFPHTTLYWGTDKENQWLKDSMEKMAEK